MAYILCIETSGTNCSIALGKDGQLIALKETEISNSHAALSAVFVEEVLKESGINKNQLEAISVSEGPGSYTGLRIGVSLAKGLCYALDIPLIAIPTLQTMALEALLTTDDKKALYAPMIDARRMEVYTAVYDADNNLISPVTPLILDNDTHSHLLEQNIIYYSGSGSIKWKENCTNGNARFINILANSAKNLVPIAQQFYNAKKFSNISYFEPQYLKLFNNLI